MHTVSKTVYEYDELSDSAKERAREHQASLAFSDSSDWDFVYEDAVAVAAMMGITIDERRGSSAPCIYFSGFSSQGDGACFEGSYRYAKGAPAAVKAHAPQDAELLRIAQALQKVQGQYFYRLRAACKQRGHYYHSGCMAVDVVDYENPCRDLGSAEDEVTQLLRDFADWIYDQLEKEHDFQTSDAQIEESIRNQECEFNEDGSPA